MIKNRIGLQAYFFELDMIGNDITSLTVFGFSSQQIAKITGFKIKKIDNFLRYHKLAPYCPCILDSGSLNEYIRIAGVPEQKYSSAQEKYRYSVLNLLNIVSKNKYCTRYVSYLFQRLDDTGIAY